MFPSDLPNYRRNDEALDFKFEYITNFIFISNSQHYHRFYNFFLSKKTINRGSCLSFAPPEMLQNREDLNWKWKPSSNLLRRRSRRKRRSGDVGRSRRRQIFCWLMRGLKKLQFIQISI